MPKMSDRRTASISITAVWQRSIVKKRGIGGKASSANGEKRQPWRRRRNGCAAAQQHRVASMLVISAAICINGAGGRGEKASKAGAPAAWRLRSRLRSAYMRTARRIAAEEHDGHGAASGRKVWSGKKCAEGRKALSQHLSLSWSPAASLLAAWREGGIEEWHQHQGDSGMLGCASALLARRREDIDGATKAAHLLRAGIAA
jgi:hypothetical protein